LDSLKINFIFESSPWLLVACALLGVVYAYVLYKKNPPWGKIPNWILAICRFLLVSLLSLLLLNFFIKKTSNKVQKKVIGIIIDNSKSINNIGKNQQNSLKIALNELQTKLIEKGFEVEIASFSENTKQIDSIKYNQSTSNLSAILQNFKSKNEGRNISDIVFVSDGINNQGIAPSSLKYAFPINTIGIGDTTSKKDLILKSIIANKIAYLKNDFIVQAEILATGFNGKAAIVNLSQNNKTIQSKSVLIKNEREPTIVEFKINSSTKGLNKYLIQIAPQAGENSLKNNYQEFYIDIIDGKENILLLAPAPHPDIKALKSIIEGNENYNITVNILNQNKQVDIYKNYDLVILHQLPDEQGSYQDLIKKLQASNTPIFYIIGNLSSIAALNIANKGVQIGASSVETDKVNGSLNKDFDLLKFDPNRASTIEKLPPIIVPFGNFQTNLETILFQKIGSTVSKKPLLLLKNTIPKSGFFLGEGLWGWRMEEYSLTEKNEIVDDLFLKVFQLLSAKDDTRKLRIYPINREIEEGQTIQLETESYNDIFQKIYNQKIKLQVFNEKNVVKNYEYNNLEGNTTFQISGLPKGMYKYVASTILGGKNETVSGEFIIKNMDTELENLQADFTELRKLSKNTGGNFFNINEIGSLQNSLINSDKPDKLISEENLEELINWPWLLFALLVLATIEWATRKYLGGY
jgi:hypothetical protein